MRKKRTVVSLKVVFITVYRVIIPVVIIVVLTPTQGLTRSSWFAGKEEDFSCEEDQR